MRTDVLGVGFDNITMAEAVEIAEAGVKGRAGMYAVTPNPEIIWECRSDERLRAIINGASLVLPDGIGVIYGAKILGRPLGGKIPGIEFAEALIERLSNTGESVFLLGAKPGVAETAARRLSEKYPGLRVCGTADGYFGDTEPLIERINLLRPGLLLVCLGSPKQEYWMYENADRLDIGLMAGLGGSLDVFAGTAQRAPLRWRRLGLEWLYRLIKEPRRIGRQLRIPLFLFAVIGQRIRGGQERP